MREGEGEREGEKTAAIPSILNQLQISREPPLQRALCHGCAGGGVVMEGGAAGEETWNQRMRQEEEEEEEDAVE